MIQCFNVLVVKNIIVIQIHVEVVLYTALAVTRKKSIEYGIKDKDYIIFI